MKRKYLLIIIPILIVLFTAMISIVTSYVSNLVGPSFKPFALPLLIIISMVVAALTVWLYILQKAPDKPSSPDSQNRQRMLAKIYARWIAGVLDQTFQNAVPIKLRLCEQSELVENPWRQTFQESDQPARLLSPGTSINQVYDEAGGELLILGEPGSGKTILLLELARDLLGRAEHNDNQPIPVYFNLSSWAAEGRSIADWLVDELNSKYHVHNRLGSSWVKNDQILPLLDGLDEVNPRYRVACIYAINQYRQAHGMVPMVVCCRSTVYSASPIRLQLRRAVTVQPLTQEQIDVYLSGEWEGLKAVHTALLEDPELRELAKTPLMLYVLTLTYYGKPVVSHKRWSSIEARRQQLFSDYVKTMLGRRAIQKLYTQEQIVYWLAWLGEQMARHKQAEFYIERIQPDWLPDNWARWVYRSITGSFIGLVTGLGIGLATGLATGLFSTVLNVFLGVFLMVFWGIVFGVVTSLIGGLVGGLIGALVGTLFTEIKPAEVIIWSWKKFRRGLIYILGFGLAIGLGAGTGIGSAIGGDGLIVGLVSGLVIGLGIGSIIALLYGLSGNMLDKHNIERPNQGIRRSARNALYIWLGGLIIGLVGGLVGTLVSGFAAWLFFWPLCWFISGFIGGLLYGGLAYIEHTVLRLLLWRAGFIPRNYPRFLNYAAERILLRKVGGGYIFIHPLLLEYFTTLDTTPDIKG